MKHLLAVLLVGALFGCSFVEDEPDAPQEATLADLQPALLPERNTKIPSVSLDELIAVYRDVLNVSKDPSTQIQVAQRLADLESMRGEERLATDGGSGLFDVAISAYTQLLQENPSNADNDKLMYQLSKAYELNGQPEKSIATLEALSVGFGASNHYAEAEFRKGETYFSQERYADAENAYANVISVGTISAYYQNALYMHGWSLFKQNRYRDSIKSLSEVLDELIPPDNQLDQMTRGDRELAEDTLRVLSVVFSYLDGPKTIDSVYKTLGQRHYIPLLYARLGELYLSQERYEDSANSYIAYVNRYPGADDAHEFYARVIDTYRKAGFADQVLEQKRNYVNRFGTNTQYWQFAKAPVQQAINTNLKKYLPELARHFHALAQTDKAASQKKGAANAAKRAEIARDNYAQAGDYYQEYVESFPGDPKTPDMAYMLGDSRLEAGQYLSAIEAYSKMAYLYKDHPKAADAGYAAIVTYDRIDPTKTDEDSLMLQREKITNELLFADVFYQDPRAVGVLLDAAKVLFELGDYVAASDTANRLIERPANDKQKVDNETLIAAWLVVGHSQFELSDYLLAESAYREALAIMPEKDKRRGDINDRAAASIYKQAELLLAAGEERAAADEFMRVVDVAPESSIRANAQYDAATHYLALEDYPQAIELLTDFRSRFPANALAAGIGLKLASAYQSTEQWSKAGGELSGIAARETDPEIKREALYQAAELYQRSGNQQRALESFREYAHNYPEPFDINIEAMVNLGDIYEQRKEGDNRRFWLKKIIDKDAGAGTARTERSRYLAAQASAVFADDAYRSFASIRLTLPIKTSLKSKKAALNKALGAYQKTNAYGVEAFSTLAGYRIGEIYRQLSKDLMASQRPAGLDELALEQYEILLEEQAFPFEEKAIEIHEKNVQRSWSGVYDEWVKESFAALATLFPARYGKSESSTPVNEEIY